jgi:glutamate dehydrogenase
MFAMDELWAGIEALDAVVPASTQVELVLEGRKLVERACRWLLGHRRLPLDVSATVTDFAPGLKFLGEHLGDLVGPADAATQAAAVERYVAANTPPALARRIAGLPDLFSGLDLADVARASLHSIESTASAYFALGEPLYLDWLRDRILGLVRDDRWQALARAAAREDLYSARAAITTEVLRLNKAGGDEALAGGQAEAEGRAGSDDKDESEAQTTGAEKVRAWFNQLGGVADRSLVALEEIASSGRTDLAAVSVGLQEMRKLLHASGPLAG